MKNRIYLDYNATAPMRPEVLDVLNALHSQPLNASAIHSFGREGRQHVETARRQIGNLIHCPAPQIIFNSGATEGNNTVLNHFKDDRILVSSIEHPSVLEAAPNAERIPVTPDGVVDLAALEVLLKAKPAALVSVMMVNNETGVIQPTAEISALAKNHGALFHTDAVQAAGRIPIDMQEMGIDFLTLSAHKLGGPQGVGALALGLCGVTPTLLIGGGQEKSARAGTENVAGIIGFGIAAEQANKAITTNNEHHRVIASKELTEVHRILESWIMSNKNMNLHGLNAPRVTNTTFFSVQNLRAETALMALDLEGIAISNGSACSSGTVGPSHVLKAMGATDDQALTGLRISTGWATTQEHIETFIEKFETFLKRTNHA